MIENIYIKLLDFGEKNFKGFNFEMVKDNLKLKDWELKIIEENMKNAHYNSGYVGARGFHGKESIFFCINLASVGEPMHENNKYILNNESYFQYIDYLELQEARKNAEEANTKAIIAIIISIVTLTASIVFSILELIIKN